MTSEPMPVVTEGHIDRWTGVRDPARRREMAAGAPPPPLPLTDEQALQRALWLHDVRGLMCPALADVMGVYHGVWLTPSGWRARLKLAGATSRWPARRRRRTELIEEPPPARPQPITSLRLTPAQEKAAPDAAAFLTQSKTRKSEEDAR